MTYKTNEEILKSLNEQVRGVTDMDLEDGEQLLSRDETILFILKLRQDDLEAIVEWVEKGILNPNKMPGNLPPTDPIEVADEAVTYVLNKVISHLKSLQGEIK